MKAAFSTLSLFAVLATLNLAIAQPSKLPTARGSMPSGDAGVDYNLVDSNGELQFEGKVIGWEWNGNWKAM